MDLQTTIDRICELCQTLRFRGSREKDLQEALEGLLRANFSGVLREAQLEPGSIVDFLVSDVVAVEVKLDGSPMDVTRQLQRYAKNARVEAVVLVTTRAKHRAVPTALREKPVRVVWLSPF